MNLARRGGALNRWDGPSVSLVVCRVDSAALSEDERLRRKSSMPGADASAAACEEGLRRRPNAFRSYRLSRETPAVDEALPSAGATGICTSLYFRHHSMKGEL